MPYVCLLLALLASGGVPDRVIARELLGLERALATTLSTRDRALMERLLDDEFVLRSEPDTSRDTWIENALTRCWGDRFEITGFKADVRDGMAVVSFELTRHVNPANCETATIRSLITDVWIDREDGWRLRMRHAGPPVAAANTIAGQYAVLPQLPPTWKIDSELSFVATGGTTSTRTLGVAGSLLHQEGNTNTRVQVSFVSSEADQETHARAIDAQARHGVTVGDGLDLFGRLAYNRDRFAGIAGRTVVETGLAYTASDTPIQTISFEASGGFTSEAHISSPDQSEAHADSPDQAEAHVDAPDQSEAHVSSPDQQFAVTTGAISYRRKITPTSELFDDVSITADLMNPTNWRTRNALNFQATLTRLLSLKLSHSIEYRHVPVPGFGRTDTRTSAALVFSFRRIPPQR